MKKKVFLLVASMIFTLACFAQQQTDKCPMGGRVDCTGFCGTFTDKNSDGFCDYSKLSGKKAECSKKEGEHKHCGQCDKKQAETKEHACKHEAGKEQHACKNEGKCEKHADKKAAEKACCDKEKKAEHACKHEGKACDKHADKKAEKSCCDKK
ncbi:MAG: hypothetical protein MJZ71_07810 [Bacteroidales bacterium]|nr:hypothetical protein [Bacteroidales bacterium]